MLRYCYSLIRYRPDQLRGEVVNIGIIIFLGQQRAEVRLIPTAGKVQAIDPQFTTSILNTIEKNLIDLCANHNDPLDQHQSLGSIYSSHLELSEAVSFFSTEENYEQTVNQLYNTLVRPQQPRNPVNFKKSNIKRFIKSELSKYKLFSQSPHGIQQGKVVENFKYSENEDLRVDFAFKNGAYHVTEVIDLTVKNLNPKFNEAGLKAITFLRSKNILGDNTKATLLYSANSSQEAKASTHLTLLGEYADQMYNCLSDQDIKSYIKYVNEHTH
ncbi:MAG: DUF3037 domain-containing protein [Porticoccaceae bacterium]|nr:DUF3037 domain-containing protein [Porticoccaceae bacterium]